MQRAAVRAAPSRFAEVLQKENFVSHPDRTARTTMGSITNVLYGTKFQSCAGCLRGFFPAT